MYMLKDISTCSRCSSGVIQLTVWWTVTREEQAVVRWLYVAKLVTHEGTTVHITGKQYQLIVTWNWQCMFLQTCIVLNQHGRTWLGIREGKWWQHWLEFCLLS